MDAKDFKAGDRVIKRVSRFKGGPEEFRPGIVDAVVDNGVNNVTVYVKYFDPVTHVLNLTAEPAVADQLELVTPS